MLRLLPGEETIFELRVVNHGDPSNISVDASPPLIKAMRLKRSNHYVESEEVIPVLARMPDNTEKVDGELLVTSESGTSRIPISMISEEEAFGEEEGTEDEEDGPASLEIKNDYDEYEDEDSEGSSESEGLRDQDADPSDGEAYPKYRSPPRRIGTTGDWTSPSHREARNYGASVDSEESRSWSDPGSRSSQEYGQANVGEREAPYYSNDGDSSSGEDASYQSPDDVAEGVETSGGLFGLDIVSEQIVPIIMFFMIIVVLALTFYTSTIPEFLGALTSSILIVTLIIYGAATLLKA